MDDPRIGQVLRAVRIRLGLRQFDVANRAGVSQQLVSSIERGQIDQRALHTVRAVAQALEVRLVMTASWRGTDLARLLDAAHASLVERVAAHLRASGWLVLVEYSFNHYGERGSVDVVAWYPTARALALVEVKSAIVDVQDLHSTVDRKRRIVPDLLRRERNWNPVAVGELLVVADRTANRAAIRRHAATFESRFPFGTVAARTWIRNPVGDIGACWFLSSTTPDGAKRDFGAARRVRRRHPRSGEAVPNPESRRDPR